MIQSATLFDYFSRTFRVERLRGANERYAATFVQAIEWLRVMLEREPTLDDLHPATLRRLMRFLYRSGLRFWTVKKMARRIATIWRHAHRGGLVEHYEVVPTLTPKNNRHAFLESPPPEGSLRLFFIRHYRPNRPNLKRDAAVNRFDVFCGRYAMLEEIDAKLLADFSDWLVKRGATPEKAGRNIGTIRAIVRKWDPERFKPQNALSELPPAEPGTLRHFIETTYMPQRLLDASASSRQGVRLMLRRQYDHYGRDIRLDEMTDALAADHFSWLLEERGLRPVSVNSAHRVYWFAAWNMAAELGKVAKAPKIRKLREHRPVADCWEPDECRRIIATIPKVPIRRHARSWDFVAFWQATLLVCWYTGARAGTLLKLRRGDLDFQTGWLTIPGDAVKNRRAKKYRLGQDALTAVAKAMRPRDDHLLPFPFRMDQFHVQFNRILAQADVSPSVRVSMTKMHRWRRSVATEIAVQKGLHAAMAMLDHSDLKTTLRYVDVSRLPGNDLTEVLPALMEGGGR